ncbi:MAG TPA: tetratricopeptide repeat protein [Chitinophagaceae bacterium]|nr:tetratricopeptide repeat protein [Chitinophagaceae bacterium]
MIKIFFTLLSIATPLLNILAQQNNPLINSGETIKEGIKLSDEGKYKEAIDYFIKVSPSDTNYVWALYEIAYASQSDSQYVVAKEYCEKALSLDEDPERLPALLTLYANTIDILGNEEEALKIYDSALQKFPAYSPLYLNKGVTLMSLKKYKEAEEVLKTSLLIDPYNYSAHFRLGQAAINQGKIIQAFLSFIAYQMMVPGGRYQSSSITLMRVISKNETDLQEYISNRNEEPSEQIQLLEQIIASKIALDKNYKSIIKLDDPIARQIQVLFEKIEYSELENDFWMQYYVPLFKQFFNTGKFEYFINYIFSQVDVDIIKTFNKKNKKEIEALVSDIISYLNTIRSTRILSYEKRIKSKPIFFFSNGELSSKGSLSTDGQNSIGDWEYFFASGNIRSRGSYDNSGKRKGKWVFYNFNGTINAIENYAEGELEGEVISYFKNGNTSSSGIYKSGKETGKHTLFYYAGGLKAEEFFKEGKLNGVRKLYFPSGNIQTIENYKEDSLDGKYENFFKNGQLESELTYINGKAEGKTKGYHENGTLNFEGQYKNDERDGTWQRYHPNKRLKNIEKYENGLLEGLYEEYHDNGQISIRYQNKKGKTFGNVEYFDDDGKLYSILTYDNDILKKAKYFDKTGKEISVSEIKNKILELNSYRPNGSKRRQNTYNDKGIQIGNETFFYNNGRINETSTYNNGQLDGLSTNYFASGKKASELTYVGGQKDGYYKGYYESGILKSEGWYKNDKAEGNWLYYNEQGDLTTKINYLNEEQYGYQTEYWPNGKINSEQKNYFGWIQEFKQYDTTGKLINAIHFPKGSGKYTSLHFNGKLYGEGTFVNGYFDGPFKYYYFDGSLESEQSLKFGETDGSYKNYFYGGALATEGEYKAGKKTGTWKYYKRNGKLSYTEQYENNELNGSQIFYNEDSKISQTNHYKEGLRDSTSNYYDETGQLSYCINYKNDIPISYTYFDKTGKLLPPIQIPLGSGKVKVFYSRGNLITEFEFIEGKINGEEKSYYSNGKLREESREEYGQTEGIYKGYYPDGKPKFQYTYKHDKAHGPYKIYNNKGIVTEEGNYYNNTLHGSIKFFDDNGVLKQTLSYYYGILLPVKK